MDGEERPEWTRKRYSVPPPCGSEARRKEGTGSERQSEVEKREKCDIPSVPLCRYTDSGHTVLKVYCTVQVGIPNCQRDINSEEKKMKRKKKGGRARVDWSVEEEGYVPPCRLRTPSSLGGTPAGGGPGTGGSRPNDTAAASSRSD